MKRLNKINIWTMILLLGMSIGFSQTKSTVVIFKFENLADDEKTNWLGSGISETLISKLSNVDEINVIERTQLNNLLKEQKIQLSGIVDEATSIEIGNMLGATVAVLGSYQVIGKMLRISGRFVNIETGEVLRSTDVTGKMDDFFTMQDQLAKNLLENQKVSISEEVIEKIAENPTESLTALEWFANGDIAYDLAEYRKAIFYYEKALEIDSSDFFTYYIIGFTYSQIQENEKAIKFYNKSIHKYSKYARVHHDLGLVYKDLNDYLSAIDSFNKAIQIKKDYWMAYENLGHTYSAMKNYKMARKSYEMAVQINPKNGDPYVNIGVNFSDQGDYKNSINFYKKALYINPESSYALVNLGVVYRKLGDYNLSIEIYKELIKNFPENSMAHYGLGLVYLELGKKDYAFDEYKILRSLDKQFADWLFDKIYE